MSLSKALSLRLVSFVWVGAILGAGFAFLTQVVLARALPPDAYGKFAAVLGIVMLFSPLASFGVPGFWLRAFGHEGWGALRWLRASLIFAVGSTLLMIGVLWVWAFFGPHDAQSGRLLLLLSAYLLGQMAVEMSVAKYQLEERYFGVALWQMAPHLARLVVVISCAVFIESPGLLLIGTAYALISVAVLGFSVPVLGHMVRGPLRLAGHGAALIASSVQAARRTPLDVARQAWPFGLANAFFLIYYQSDIILLKYLEGDAAAGIYNVAFIVMAAVYLLPGVTYQKFLMPKIHRWAAHDRAMFASVYRQGNIAMLILGIVAALGIWGFGEFGVTLLFGESYMAAAVPLTILAVGAPIRFVATSVESVLVSESNMKLKAAIMGSTALLNVGLNLVLIPRYGMSGAAWATVASDVLLLILYLVVAQRKVFRNPVSS